MSGEARFAAPISEYVWNAAAVGVNGYSAVFDSWNSPFITIAGTSSGASTITVWGSSDATNWFVLGTISATATAGSLYLALTCGVEFIKLQSSASVTLTAVISAKG